MRISPLLIACLGLYPITAQVESGSIFRVRVINSVTKGPVRGASIELVREGRDLSGRTNASGIFEGRAQSGAAHLLTVTRDGYRMTGIGGKMVDIKAGGETDVTIEMLPLGVLTGRVLDQYGDPVRRAIVRTEDLVSLPGQDPYYDGHSVAATDDRGEYRMPDVEPGKHYIAVEYSTGNERYSPVRSRYRWPELGGLLLYRGATEIENAQQVQVGAGATVRLDDIQLRIQPLVTISGRIKPPPVERIPPVSLERKDKLGLHSGPTLQAGSEANGSFTISALPGTYILTASDPKTGKTSKPLTLKLTDKDITDLELELITAYEINGRFIVEGQERIDFSKLELNFGGSPVKLDASGSFKANLGRNKATYILQGLAEDWYVKDIVLGGRSIAGRQFEVEAGSTDMVITLSPRGARVEITVERSGDRLQPLYVVLLPEHRPLPDVESILHAQAQPSGKFAMHAVPPGSYRIFTLDASNWEVLFRPDILLEKNRQSAPLIDVAEGENKNITVPLTTIQP